MNTDEHQLLVGILTQLKSIADSMSYLVEKDRRREEIKDAMNTLKKQHPDMDFYAD